MRFVDDFGHWHEWSAPLQMLKGLGRRAARRATGPGDANRPRATVTCSAQWLMGQHPKARIIAATRCGWHGHTAAAFASPSRTIGADNIRYQCEYSAHDAYSQRGTLQRWREHVAAPCRENPVLIPGGIGSIRRAVDPGRAAAPQGGAGIHLVGDSRGGVLTALQVAASVWGSPDYGE
ncbi:MAG: DUF927 domain-containing protein [Arhodomonas sp.]|nr:DUF927 domain-containing protein [Arhodomonas sp.]